MQRQTAASPQQTQTAASLILRELVSQQDDAGPEPARLDELQVDLVTQFWEHRFTAPQDYGVNIELVFIDQAELHEG